MGDYQWLIERVMKGNTKSVLVFIIVLVGAIELISSVFSNKKANEKT